MRPIIAGLTAGLLTALVNRFLDGLSNEIIAGLVIGAISGIGVMYAMRPRRHTQGQGDTE